MSSTIPALELRNIRAVDRSSNDRRQVIGFTASLRSSISVTQPMEYWRMPKFIVEVFPQANNVRCDLTEIEESAAKL
jgi:hypothetical protein